MQNLIKLKPCPFCGNSMEWNEYEYPSGSVCPKITGHYFECVLCYSDLEIDDDDFTEDDDDGNMVVDEEEKIRLMNELAEKWNERCESEVIEV